MKKYKINILSVADVSIPTPFILYHTFDNKMVTVPTYMFLISGEDIPPILIDSGVKEDSSTLTTLYPEMTSVTPPQKEKSIKYQLAKFGYTPEDIKVLVHTHLHVDHAGNDHMFPNAKIIISRKEMMFSVAGIDPGYPAEYITYLVEEQHKPGRVRLIDEDITLFEGIKLIITEGHTMGSTIISVETEKGLAYICGDIIYNQKMQCIDNPYGDKDVIAHSSSCVEPFGDHVSGNNWNLWTTKTAMQKIMREADLVLPSHDTYVLEHYGDTI